MAVTVSTTDAFVFGSTRRRRRTARTFALGPERTLPVVEEERLRPQDVLLLPGGDVPGEEDLPVRRRDAQEIGLGEGRRVRSSAEELGARASPERRSSRFRHTSIRSSRRNQVRTVAVTRAFSSS